MKKTIEFRDYTRDNPNFVPQINEYVYFSHVDTGNKLRKRLRAALNTENINRPDLTGDIDPTRIKRKDPRTEANQTFMDLWNDPRAEPIIRAFRESGVKVFCANRIIEAQIYQRRFAYEIFFTLGGSRREHCVTIRMGAEKNRVEMFDTVRKHLKKPVSVNSKMINAMNNEASLRIVGYGTIGSRSANIYGQQILRLENASKIKVKPKGKHPKKNKQKSNNQPVAPQTIGTMEPEVKSKCATDYRWLKGSDQFAEIFEIPTKPTRSEPKPHRKSQRLPCASRS